MELNQQDIQNLLALINLAPIQGNQATTVAILQQKLQKMLTPVEPVTEDKPAEAV